MPQSTQKSTKAAVKAPPAPLNVKSTVNAHSTVKPELPPGSTVKSSLSAGEPETALGVSAAAGTGTGADKKMLGLIKVQVQVPSKARGLLKVQVRLKLPLMKASRPPRRMYRRQRLSLQPAWRRRPYALAQVQVLKGLYGGAPDTSALKAAEPAAAAAEASGQGTDAASAAALRASAPGTAVSEAGAPEGAVPKAAGTAAEATDASALSTAEPAAGVPEESVPGTWKTAAGKPGTAAGRQGSASLTESHALHALNEADSSKDADLLKEPYSLNKAETYLLKKPDPSSLKSNNEARKLNEDSRAERGQAAAAGETVKAAAVASVSAASSESRQEGSGDSAESAESTESPAAGSWWARALRRLGLDQASRRLGQEQGRGLFYKLRIYLAAAVLFLGYYAYSAYLRPAEDPIDELERSLPLRVDAYTVMQEARVTESDVTLVIDQDPAVFGEASVKDRDQILAKIEANAPALCRNSLLRQIIASGKSLTVLLRGTDGSYERRYTLKSCPLPEAEAQ